MPASATFADRLAQVLIHDLNGHAEPLALAKATIYLPTRRAVRTVSDAFARQLGGAALLPHITPLGDVDEEEMNFDPGFGGISELTPISVQRRQLLLATMIRQWRHAKAEPVSFAQATSLARSLAGFLDEMHVQGASFEKIADLAPNALTEYWMQVRDFLALLVEQWPALLKAENACNHAEYRNEMLRSVAQQLSANPPQGPVIAAGSTGSIPATAELLQVIAHLPEGAVILPGLDLHLDQTSWEKLDAGHPQFGMKQLLERMQLSRSDVRLWGNITKPNPREILLTETLRPAPTTDAWRALVRNGQEIIAEGLKGLSLVEADDVAQEAFSIALILRDVLNQPGRTGALVTPDRQLARRVASELERWNIAVDDSAGKPLTRTPPGNLLCLLAEAVAQDFSPVPLLAFLKHPLVSGGMAAGQFRVMTRRLDLALRGPKPDSGLRSIELALKGDERLKKWFAELSNKFAAFDRLYEGETPLDALLRKHVQVAQNLCSTDLELGEDRLWQGEAGQAAAQMMRDMIEAASSLPPIDTASYAAWFRSMVEERALRPQFGKHPRLAILGPLEARLQHYDVMILGELNEGVWPRDASIDPWLSRPMRKALGLEQPERSIGLAAHDFATLAAAPQTYLTRARKMNGSPSVASRWLQRLKQLTRGLNFEPALIPIADYAAYAEILREPKLTERMARPSPKPPVEARPRKLSVTEIETWLRDPYAIYARRVLNLRKLDPLDADIGASQRGSAIHRVLERFIRDYPDGPSIDAELGLITLADEVFAEENIPKSVLALWRPRFLRAARWFVGAERGRRMNVVRAHVEMKGEMTFTLPGGDFLLHGRADRIDELVGGAAALIDYKTGKPPSEKQVQQLLAVQLPLEAAILAEGGFSAVGKLLTAELVYIRFSGGSTPGEVSVVKGDAMELAQKAAAQLKSRIMDYDHPDQAYIPRVMPYLKNIAGDYDHLARVDEWSQSGWGDDEE